MADSEYCSREEIEKERRNRADGAGARYLVWTAAGCGARRAVGLLRRGVGRGGERICATGLQQDVVVQPQREGAIDESKSV